MEELLNSGQARPLPPLSKFQSMLPFVRPYWKRLALVFFLTLVSSILGLSYPLGAKFLVDNAFAGRNERLLFAAAIVLAGLILAGFVVGAVTKYLYTQVSSRILMDMRLFLFRHLQLLSPRFYSGTRTGEILSRLSGDVAEIQSVTTDALFSFALSALTFAGTVALLIYLDWRLFLLCTFFLPFCGRLLVGYRDRIAVQARAVREQNANLSSALLESLQGMKWINVAGAEELEAGKVATRNERYIDSLLRYQLVSAYANAVPTWILGASTLLLLLYGGHRVIAGAMSLGSLIAFAAYQARVLSPMQNMIGLYLSLQRARVALDRVLELLRIEPEIAEAPDAVELHDPIGELELRNVSFAYRPGHSVLHHINLHITPGSRVGIVGPSGAGKSTLVDLLLRFYDPQEGAVLLDGHDLRHLKLRSVRDAIAMVSSEPFLFHASVEENLRCAQPEASDEQLRWALGTADLKDFVSTLPSGIATVIGERGFKLSTGQRQRLAIARALLRNAPIWVFDEATGALDVLTEARIWSSLGQGLAGRTTIIISHRLSSVRDADWTVVLDSGEVVQQGRHERLVESEGLYRQLHALASPHLHAISGEVAS